MRVANLWIGCEDTFSDIHVLSGFAMRSRCSTSSPGGNLVVGLPLSELIAAINGPRAWVYLATCNAGLPYIHLPEPTKTLCIASQHDVPVTLACAPSNLGGHTSEFRSTHITRLCALHSAFGCAPSDIGGRTSEVCPTNRTRLCALQVRWFDCTSCPRVLAPLACSRPWRARATGVSRPPLP